MAGARYSHVQGLSKAQIAAGVRNPPRPPIPPQHKPSGPSAYRPTPSDRNRPSGPEFPDISPPPERKGIAGQAEASFLTLTFVAVAGLAVFHVQPFTQMLTWVGNVFADFGKLASAKR